MAEAILAPDRNVTEYSFEYKGDLYYVLRSGSVIGGMYSYELEGIIKLYRILYSSPRSDGIHYFENAFNVKLTDYIDRTNTIY